MKNAVFLPTSYYKDLTSPKSVHRNCTPSCVWRSLRWKFLYRRTLLHCSDTQGWNSAKTTAFFQQQQQQKKKKIYKVIAPFIKRHRWSENMQKDFTLFAAISISSRLFSSLIRQERFQTASWLQSLRKTYSDYTSAFNFGSLCHWLFTKSAIC